MLLSTLFLTKPVHTIRSDFKLQTGGNTLKPIPYTKTELKIIIKLY